jgi:hypothetical protein
MKKKSYGVSLPEIFLANLLGFGQVDKEKIFGCTVSQMIKAIMMFVVDSSKYKIIVVDSN